MSPEEVIGTAVAPKPKGRPKGSKNKPKSKVEELYNEAWPDPDESVTIHGDTEWVLARSEVTVLLQSHEVPEGLEMVLQKHVIVGLSTLPNGNASIITNIGTDQPLILVTAEPYVDIKKRLYPGLS